MEDLIQYTLANNSDKVFSLLQNAGYSFTNDDDVEIKIAEFISQSPENMEAFLRIHPDFEVLKEIYQEDNKKLLSNKLSNLTSQVNLTDIKRNVSQGIKDNDMLKYALFAVVIILLIKIV